MGNGQKGISGHRSEEWEVILELLKRTDPDLYLRIARKMLNLLVWKGVSEANKMLQQFNPYATVEKEIELVGEVNEPLKRKTLPILIAGLRKFLCWLHSTCPIQKF